MSDPRTEDRSPSDKLIRIAERLGSMPDSEPEFGPEEITKVDLPKQPFLAFQAIPKENRTTVAIVAIVALTLISLTAILNGDGGLLSRIVSAFD